MSVGTRVLETRVAPDWIDYNGHMNDAAYARVFSLSVDALMDRIGLDAAAREASGRTLYTLSMMIHYFGEAKLGERLNVAARVLEHDNKRLRLWLEMARVAEEQPIAASEQLLISMDVSGETPRVATWRAETAAALETLAADEVGRTPPPQAGRGITLRRAES